MASLAPSSSTCRSPPPLHDSRDMNNSGNNRYGTLSFLPVAVVEEGGYTKLLDIL